jgi:hypothetical protein
VVDLAARSHVAVVHGLGAVPVGVEEEPAVVVLRVLRARPGRAVVAVAGLGAGAPELVHLGTRARPEAHVEAVRDRLVLTRRRDREEAPLRQLVVAVLLLDAERAQHRVVEALRSLPVGDADLHVVEHAPTIPDVLETAAAAAS